MKGELHTCPDCRDAAPARPGLLDRISGSTRGMADCGDALVCNVRAIFGRRYRWGLLRWRLLNHLAMHAGPERRDPSRTGRD